MDPAAIAVAASSVSEQGASEQGVCASGAADEQVLSAFAELGLKAELLKALGTLGYEEPTPIQREAIPHLLAGSDLLGQAATGTGKTAAFALPILELIQPGPATPVALVLVPTRELAMQVSEAIYKYGHDLNARPVPIYGGQHIGRQLDALRRGTHVVVATPGRALDHIRRKSLPLDSVKMVVLDEADEMLDMGFAEDLEAILAATPASRQTVLFSATMPPRIDAIARKHLRNPVRIQIRPQVGEAGSTPQVRQVAYVVRRAHKAAALGRILDVEAPPASLVFCRTRLEVDQLTETMNGRGFRADSLHGGMDQQQRDKVMGRFRSGATELLVATDVAARGLDIDHLTHVFNYEVPSSPEAYVHRIGRVGRAGRVGVAITLVDPRERRLLGNIEHLTKQQIAVQSVPSVADLRALRLDQTLATMREATGADRNHLERFRRVVETLADESDLMQVALAAVKLVHESSGASDDEQEIPDLSAREEHPGKSYDERNGSFAKKKHRKGAEASERTSGHSKENGKEHRGTSSGYERKDRIQHGKQGRLFVGVGKSTGVRPQDLVGAIAGESRLRGADIGAIKIADHYSVVEIPAAAIDDVVRAMTKTMIKGNKAKVRRYTDERTK
ncbi:MAG: ATP-dependent RNA helicase DeaD [Gammaproteobacteria bacterium]|jgi:ATP-dependent RNA helicase DeaD